VAEVNLGLLPELIALGLAVGVISGLFGVGGGFLLTPMLNVIFGLPYNIAVGTGIFVTLGTSIVGAIRHWRLGNVDLKLGLLMLTGGIPGVLGGVRLVEALEQAGEVKLLGGRMSAVDFVLSLVFLLLLGLVGLFSLFESRRALCKGERPSKTPSGNVPFGLRLPPLVCLKRCESQLASLWAILGIGAGAGFAAGLMGVGGGFLLVPAMIYLLRAPTKVAVGTSLFQVAFSSVLSTFLHAHGENLLLPVALSVLAGSIFGVQVGALLTVRLPGARIRFLFSLLLFGAALAVLLKLLARLGVS